MTEATTAEQWVRDAGETLVAHTRMNPPSGRCYCGHEVPLGHSFAEHQAAALGDLVAAREAQAAAKALREAADECDSTGHHWSGRPALAFFAVASELRDRADRIERGES